MPVEDPRADAKVYLAKHNVEKIFEVRLRPAALTPRALAFPPRSCSARWPSAVLCRSAALPAPRPAGAS